MLLDVWASCWKQRWEGRPPLYKFESGIEAERLLMICTPRSDLCISHHHFCAKRWAWLAILSFPSYQPPLNDDDIGYWERWFSNYWIIECFFVPLFKLHLQKERRLLKLQKLLAKLWPLSASPLLYQSTLADQTKKCTKLLYVVSTVLPFVQLHRGLHVHKLDGSWPWKL